MLREGGGTQASTALGQPEQVQVQLLLSEAPGSGAGGCVAPGSEPPTATGGVRDPHAAAPDVGAHAISPAICHLLSQRGDLCADLTADGRPATGEDECAVHPRLRSVSSSKGMCKLFISALAGG